MTAADSGYDTYSEYQHPASDPLNRRFQPPVNVPRSHTAGSLPSPQTAAPNPGGLSWKPNVNRTESNPSRGSTVPGPNTPTMQTFNQTAPLMEEEERTVKSGSKSGFSDASSDLSGQSAKKNKITPNSEVRYYGRGELLCQTEESTR